MPAATRQSRLVLRSGLAWWLGITAVGSSMVAHAGVDARAREPAEVGEPASVVIGIPEADPILREATLRPALAGHFADTRFRPELRRLPAGDILAHLEWAEGEPAGLSHAVLWVETGRDGGPQLYLLQPSSGRVWVRALPMASDPEVAAESLGVMVRALALGLAAGEPAGMREVMLARASAAEPPPKPVSPPPPARPDVLVAVGYHGSSVAADRPWHSGAELRLGLRWPMGFVVELGAAWAPRAAGLRSPRVDLERVPLDVRAGWQWRPHPRLHPQVDATVVAEALRWDVPSTEMLAGRSGTSWRLGVAPGAGLTVRLWRGLGLRVHAQADVWLRNASLVVLEEDGQAPLTRMHPLAGRLDAGLAIWL